MERLNIQIQKYIEFERSKDVSVLRNAYLNALDTYKKTGEDFDKEELFKVAELYFTTFVQNYMDSKVKERNYDSVHTCIGTYIDSPVKKFADEAKAVKDWVSYVWEKCYAIIDEVKAGERELPTEETLIEELPELVW